MKHMHGTAHSNNMKEEEAIKKQFTKHASARFRHASLFSKSVEGLGFAALCPSPSGHAACSLSLTILGHPENKHDG